MLAEYYTFVQLNSSNFAFGPDKINILLRIPYIYIYTIFPFLPYVKLYSMVCELPVTTINKFEVFKKIL